jgi:ABC-2 type transport system permease protein
MTALTIAVNELRRMLRDRSNLFFVLLLPLLLVLFIGTAMQTGATLAVSGTGPLTDQLVTALRDGGAFSEVTVRDPGAESDAAQALALARDAVARGLVSAAVTVPPTGPDARGALTEDPSRTVIVEVLAREASVASAVAEVVRDALAPLTAALDATRLTVVVTGATADAVEDTARAVVDGAAAGAGGRVDVTSVGGDPLAAEFQAMGRFDLGASTQLVLFTFLTAMVGAVGLIRTRELGIAGRIRSTATPLVTLLGGQALGRIAVAVFQAGYLVIATTLLFGASWGDPLATGAVLVVFSAVAGGAGMLVGTLARNEAQASGLGIGLGIGLGALGGSMVPLEIMPAALVRVAQLTPHAWANTEFAEIVRRDGRIGDVLVELAVLAAFAVVLLGLAVVVLRRRLARG